MLQSVSVVVSAVPRRFIVHPQDWAKGRIQEMVDPRDPDGEDKLYLHQSHERRKTIQRDREMSASRSKDVDDKVALSDKTDTREWGANV